MDWNAEINRSARKAGRIPAGVAGCSEVCWSCDPDGVAWELAPAIPSPVAGGRWNRDPAEVAWEQVQLFVRNLPFLMLESRSCRGRLGTHLVDAHMAFLLGWNRDPAGIAWEVRGGRLVLAQS